MKLFNIYFKHKGKFKYQLIAVLKKLNLINSRATFATNFQIINKFKMNKITSLKTDATLLEHDVNLVFSVIGFKASLCDKSSNEFFFNHII